MRRALVIQLARLGDLLQTIPAITALKTADPDRSLDLLCPAPLASVGRMVPGIDRVLEWDGTDWQRRAREATAELRPAHLREAEDRINALSSHRYEHAYVLNQHPRALLAGALLACSVIGPKPDGPLGERLSPWAAYVREVALTRRGCRVHLADAFCGLCGVYPPGRPPIVNRSSGLLPPDLEPIGKQGGPWIGLIVGAGSAERLVPIEVWRRWIVRFLETAPAGRVVMLGQERERGRLLQDLLPPSLLNRAWDVTGRTSLPELASILSRCHTVIGADTGPLHLAAAVGAKVIGWYFARARVHETGPYGAHHLVWQAVEERGGVGMPCAGAQPADWPIEETLAALTKGRVEGTKGWSVWTSHCDRWGAYYSEVGGCSASPPEREALWHELLPAVR